MHLKIALKLEYGQPNEQVSLDSFVRTPPIPAQDNHETLIVHRCPDNSLYRLGRCPDLIVNLFW